MKKRKPLKRLNVSNVSFSLSIWERSLLKLQNKISGYRLQSNMSYYLDMFKKASSFKANGVYIGRRIDLEPYVRSSGVTAVEMDKNGLQQPCVTRKYLKGQGGILSDNNWDIYLNYVWLLGAMKSGSKITMVLPKNFFENPHLSLSRVTPQGVKGSVTAQEIGNLLSFGFKPEYVSKVDSLKVVFTPPNTFSKDLLPEHMGYFSHEATMDFLSSIMPAKAPHSEPRVRPSTKKSTQLRRLSFNLR